MVFELYQVFSRLNKADEDFDKFYYWGNVLLQDFDELDKFLVDAGLLFQNLVHIKNLENESGFSPGRSESAHHQGILEKLWR
jgi:hypothetical protein